MLSAAADVEPDAWPRPTETAFADRVAGVFGRATSEDGQRISRDDAVAAYVAALAARDEPYAALVDDAAEQLRAADRLARIAEDLATTADLTMADVAVLEQAILDLRASRRIYLDAWRRLDDAWGLPAATSIDRAQIDRAFEDTTRRVGAAADRLADRVMDGERRAVAGPTLARLNG
ncbi:MAG: hypothetical protein ACFB00_05100 [Parvularculaceae bacterium]